MDKNECEDRFSESETEEHLNGKRDLFEWIKKQSGVTNAVLEGWLPETKQRPDIIFDYNGQKYVIEYQCSPIASEYLERHDLYQASGINDIWILGTDKYLEKSEIGKTFRTKEIEKHTNNYYDTKGGSIITCNISTSNLSDLCVREMHSFPNIEFNYFHEKKRKEVFDYLLSNNLILYLFNKKYICPLNVLSFSKKGLVINNESSKSIEKYFCKKRQDKLIFKENLDKVANFRNKIFEYYSAQYNLNLSTMPSQSDVSGFKHLRNYFGFKDIKNYPIVDFCEINYLHDEATYNHLITIDISDDGFELVKNVLDEKFSMEIKFKKERKEKYDSLFKNLSEFKDIPIYLLFMEDNNKLSHNIRFKFFDGVSDDILVTMERLYNDLKFLKKKNAKRYTFMIPRKKWRTSSTGRSQYKVWNHPREVISDFEELGFKVLTYDDLMSEVQD